jgi:hypothetical protein
MRVVIAMRLGLVLLGLSVVVGQSYGVVNTGGVVDNYQNNRLINRHCQSVEFLEAWTRLCIEEECELETITPIVVAVEKLMGILWPAPRSKKTGRLVTAKKYQQLGRLIEPLTTQASAKSCRWCWR